MTRVSPRHLPAAARAVQRANASRRRENPVLFNPYCMPGAFACTLETGATGCGYPSAPGWGAWWTGPSQLQPSCPPSYVGVADDVARVRSWWPSENLYATRGPCDTSGRRS